MQTELPHQVDRSPAPEFREAGLESGPEVSLSHFTHTLHNYRNVILLTLAIVALLYAILAMAIYLSTPTLRVTSQAFRLDFEGAGEGRYPNGTKFNIADIINGPTLARVFKDNNLAEYASLGDFSRSVYVLESNRQYETLAAEYEALLADPKLSSVERQRLQGEFEMKRQSIAKNEYAIHLSRSGGVTRIPEPIARKVLLDVLNGWADFAVNQQHVITYDVAVISPSVLTESATRQDDVVARIALLRAKANQAIDTIDVIARLPGARLARTPTDQLSLEEVRLRLEDVVRFDLEPLQALALRSPAVITDRARTAQFLDNQLAYDQRQLQAVERRAQAIRNAIAVYQSPLEGSTTATGDAAPQPRVQRSQRDGDRTGSEAVPQLSDTFLDRLMALTSHSGDFEYRQRLADDYRKAAEASIPVQKSVAYDQQLMSVFAAGDRGAKLAPAEVQTAVEGIRVNLVQLVGQMNEVFRVISRNMTASTQLFSLTGTPSVRTLRAIDVIRLALYGILLMLIALPLTIIGCMLHNRVREEEAAEQSAI